LHAVQKRVRTETPTNTATPTETPTETPAHTPTATPPSSEVSQLPNTGSGIFGGWDNRVVFMVLLGLIALGVGMHTRQQRRLARDASRTD